MAEEWVVWRNAGLTSIKNAKQLDPARLGPELQRHPTNEAALEAAKNRRNPLNAHLEWDDAVCGVIHRLGQIASLRSCIRLYDTATGDTKKAFIGIRDEEGGHRARYYSPQQVIDSVEIQRRLIEQAVKRLDAFETDFREIMDLCEGVRSIRDRLIARLDTLGRGASV